MSGSPLQETLAESFSRAFRIAHAGACHVGALEDTAGWLSLHDLTTGGALEGAYQRFDQIVAAEFPRRTREYVGQTLFESALWSPLAAAAYAFVTERRVPAISQHILFKTEPGLERMALVQPRAYVLPDDALASEPDVTVVPDLDALTLALWQEVQALALPLLDAFAARRYVSRANARAAILDVMCEGAQLPAWEDKRLLEAVWSEWERICDLSPIQAARRPHRYSTRIGGVPVENYLRAGCCRAHLSPSRQKRFLPYCYTCFIPDEDTRHHAYLRLQEQERQAEAGTSGERQ